MKVCAFGPGPRVACGFLILCTVLFATTAPSTVRAAGVVGTGTATSCTETALDAALAGGGLVTFNCGPAPVTLNVSTGTGTKTITSDTIIDGGDLITIEGAAFAVSGAVFTAKDLTFVGSGTLFGDPAIGRRFRLLNGVGSVTVTSGVSFRDSASGAIVNFGEIFVSDSTFFANSNVDAPGAILNGGTATVTNSTFTGNQNLWSYDCPCQGGAIANSGTMTITTSTFSGNDTHGPGSPGGAIYNGGTLIVTTSTFSDNSSDGAAGAIENVGMLTVTASTFSGNGAIIINSDTATVTNSTFSDFYTFNNSSGGTLTITNTTLSGFISNAGTATLRNTIVSNCWSGSGTAPIIDGGHNLDAGSGCGFSAAGGSLSNTAPLLDPQGLQDNGGPTHTVALCKGIGVPVGCTAASPAIDAGDPAVCAAPPVNNLDQRGFMRPGAGHTNCSIGAYEADAPDCGNGQVEPGEQCDDGNSVNGDCCSSTCQFEPLNSPCNDNNLCTTGDRCTGAGVCGFSSCSEQAITGKKLLLKSTPKMVLLSTDALIAPGAAGSSSDPRCVAAGGSGSGASVELDDGTNSVILAMPCANWIANGSGSLFRFKDPAGGRTTARIRAGLLKLGSRAGMGGFPVPSGPATVNVTVTVGTDTYCMTFNGTGDGSKFLVRDAAAGACP